MQGERRNVNGQNRPCRKRWTGQPKQTMQRYDREVTRQFTEIPSEYLLLSATEITAARVFRLAQTATSLALRTVYRMAKVCCAHGHARAVSFPPLVTSPLPACSRPYKESV